MPMLLLNVELLEPRDSACWTLSPMTLFLSDRGEKGGIREEEGVGNPGAPQQRENPI